MLRVVYCTDLDSDLYVAYFKDAEEVAQFVYESTHADEWRMEIDIMQVCYATPSGLYRDLYEGDITSEDFHSYVATMIHEPEEFNWAGQIRKVWNLMR